MWTMFYSILFLILFTLSETIADWPIQREKYQVVINDEAYKNQQDEMNRPIFIFRARLLNQDQPLKRSQEAREVDPPVNYPIAKNKETLQLGDDFKYNLLKRLQFLASLYRAQQNEPFYSSNDENSNIKDLHEYKPPNENKIHKKNKGFESQEQKVPDLKDVEKEKPKLLFKSKIMKSDKTLKDRKDLPEWEIHNLLMKEKELLKKIEILERHELLFKKSYEVKENEQKMVDDGKYVKEFDEKVHKIKIMILKFLNWRTEKQAKDILSGKTVDNSLFKRSKFYQELRQLLRMLKLIDNIKYMESSNSHSKIKENFITNRLSDYEDSVYKKKKPRLIVDRNQIIPNLNEDNTKLVNQNDKPCQVIYKDQVFPESQTKTAKSDKPCFIIMERKHKDLVPLPEKGEDKVRIKNKQTKEEVGNETKLDKKAKRINNVEILNKNENVSDVKSHPKGSLKKDESSVEKNDEANSSDDNPELVADKYIFPIWKIRRWALLQQYGAVLDSNNYPSPYMDMEPALEKRGFSMLTRLRLFSTLFEGKNGYRPLPRLIFPKDSAFLKDNDLIKAETRAMMRPMGAPLRWG